MGQGPPGQPKNQHNEVVKSGIETPNRQDAKPPGRPRDKLSEGNISSTACKTMEDGSHGTMDNAGLNLPSLQAILGEPISRANNNIMHAEKDNTGLNPPSLQATGKLILGANKKRMHVENHKRRWALQQAQ